MDRHDWLVLLVGAVVVALFAVLAMTQGNNELFGKAGREARQVK
jgi:hypothetical protein